MYKNNLLNLNLFFIFLLLLIFSLYFLPSIFPLYFLSFAFSLKFTGTKHSLIVFRNQTYHKRAPLPLTITATSTIVPISSTLQAPQMHPPETAIATPSPIHYCHGTINHKKFFFNIFLFPQYSLEPSIS